MSELKTRIARVSCRLSSTGLHSLPRIKLHRWRKYFYGVPCTFKALYSPLLRTRPPRTVECRIVGLSSKLMVNTDFFHRCLHWLTPQQGLHPQKLDNWLVRGGYGLRMKKDGVVLQPEHLGCELVSHFVHFDWTSFHIVAFLLVNHPKRFRCILSRFHWCISRGC